MLCQSSKVPGYCFELFSEKGAENYLHCTGVLQFVSSKQNVTIKQNVTHPHFKTKLDSEEFYKLLSKQGVEIGRSFKIVKSLAYERNNFFAELEIKYILDQKKLNCMDPRLLDAVFQSVIYGWKLSNKYQANVNFVVC